MRKKILTVLTIFVIVNFVNAKENFATNVKEKYELITYDFHNLEFQLPKEFQVTIRNSTKKPSGSYIEKVTVDEYLKLPIYMINEKVSNMVSQGKIVTSDDLKNFCHKVNPIFYYPILV